MGPFSHMGSHLQLQGVQAGGEAWQKWPSLSLQTEGGGAPPPHKHSRPLPSLPLPSASPPSSPQLMLRTYWTAGQWHVWVPGRAHSPADTHTQLQQAFRQGRLPPRQLPPRSGGSPVLKSFHTMCDAICFPHEPVPHPDVVSMVP